MLKHNAVLTTLYLGDNRVGDSGAKSLAQALKVNTALTTLELWHNNIGAEGARALGEVLKNNSALSRLGRDGERDARATRAPAQQRARLKTPRR